MSSLIAPKCLDVYLLRHTQPVLDQSICYGQLDCALAESYQSELSKLTDYFKEIPISAIYSSPLQRCAILAKDLANKQGATVEVQLKEHLKEINFGDWEGVPWGKISRQKIEAWNAQRLHFQFPNGETPYQFDQRVIKEWQEIVKQHLQNRSEVQTWQDKEIIVMVAHAGVIRSILCDFLSIPFAQSVKLQIDKASVSRLSFQGELSSCLFVNKKL